MMKRTIFGILTAGLAMSVSAQAHPAGSRVALEPKLAGSFQAGKLHYEFRLVDTQLHMELSDRDLRITHEKILHLYMYDPALLEFRHEHPVFDGKLWSMDTDIP